MNLSENSEEIDAFSEEHKDYNGNGDRIDYELRDDMDESVLLEQLVGFNIHNNSSSKNKDSFKSSSQKPIQTENDVYEIDLNRKIVLFSMIVDLDVLVNYRNLHQKYLKSLIIGRF